MHGDYPRLRSALLLGDQMSLRFVNRFFRAQDFDASAAVSPAEAAAQLKASMSDGGGSGKEEETPPAPAKAESETPDDDDDEDDDDGPLEKTESIERGKEKPVAAATDEPAPGTKDAIKSSPLLQKILDKYGNDPDKFAEALFHQQNSVAALHTELKELREQLTAKVDEDEDLVHPDAALIEEDLEGFELELKENAADQAALVRKGEVLREEMSSLRGELKHADQDDKRGIEAQIEAKQSRLETLSDKWKDIEKRNTSVRREVKFATRRLEQLKTEVETVKETRKADREKAKQWQTDQRKTFDTAVDDLSKVYKATTEDISYLHGILKAEASLYLRSLKETDPAIDLKKFVEARAEVHAKRLGLAKHGELTKKTTDKLKSTEPVKSPSAAPRAPATPPPARRPSDRHLSTREKADQARLHAAKILGG